MKYLHTRRVLRLIDTLFLPWDIGFTHGGYTPFHYGQETLLRAIAPN
jgi:hypothetical protein